MNLFDDPNSMALLAAGASLLDAGGPSLTPQRFGPAMGKAINAYMSVLPQAKKQIANQQFSDVIVQKLGGDPSKVGMGGFNGGLGSLLNDPKVAPVVFSAAAAGNPVAAQMVQAGLKGPEGFTLGPGQVRFGPDGKPLAAGAPKETGPFSGTGIEAQDRNTLIRLAPKISNGTATPEERQAYALAYRNETEPRIVGSYDTGFQMVPRSSLPEAIPSPFPQPNQQQRPESQTQETGQTPVPLTPKRQSPGDAAKTAGMVQGVRDMDRAAPLLFQEGNFRSGGINRDVLLAMKPPLMGGPVPFTEGGRLFSLLYNAAEGMVRSQSGAEVPEQEIKRMALRMVPSWRDNDATIRSKYSRLREFLADTINRIDPTGETLREAEGNNVDDLVEKYAPNG